MTTIKVKGVDIPVDVYQKMLDEGLVIHKHDTVGASPSVQTPHGLFQDQNVGGLFTRPGAEPDIYSAFTTPTGGQMLADLYAGTSVITDPEYDIITGVKAGTGSNAENFCEPGPKAGFAKLCTTRAQFGKFKMDFDQVNLMETGGRINRADVDYRIVNNPALFPLAPDVLARAGNPNTTLGLQLMRMAVHIGRVLPRVLFHGSITNTGANAELGFIQEFNGFDAVIKTNHTDIESGDACVAADSLIVNWNHTSASGTVNGADLVETVAGIAYYLMSLSEDSNLPATWKMGMHRDLFWFLTSIWPCSYITNACALSTSNGESLNVDAATQIQMRDEMRNGKFLWVNGIRFPVYVTSAIEQTAVGAGYSSPIYFIPLTALGARVTYLEGFDLNNADIQEFQEFYASGLPITTMNNGLYMKGTRVTDACVEGWLAAKLRLIMRTPWLAARIENVNYALPGKLYTRDPYPDGQYHKDGGRYFTPAPSYS